MHREAYSCNKAGCLCTPPSSWTLVSEDLLLPFRMDLLIIDPLKYLNTTEDEAKETDLRQNKGYQVNPFTGYEL